MFGDRKGNPMADIVTLDEAKAQLQILNADEDVRVQTLIDIATEHVCKAILDDPNPPPAKPIKGAVLLLIGELDANRGTTIDAAVTKNPLFMQMLQPYRKRIGV